MLIMLILLLQSAYNIFLDEPAYQEENTIDVIVRTSQAAIFGYFLSANFANRNIKKKITKILKSIELKMKI